MGQEFFDAVEEIKREKSLDEDVVVEALREALTRAVRRDFEYPSDAEIRIDIDFDERLLDAYVRKSVVGESRNGPLEIDVESARRFSPAIEIGEELWYPLNLQRMSRTATHTVKQAIGERIKGAVEDRLYEKYRDRKLQLVNGVVRRIDEKTVYVGLDEEVEALLPYREQVENDDYRMGNRMKFLIVKVRLKERGLQVVASRTHPALIERLFELHIPEVHDGLVEVVNVAREAGTRSKVAVQCHDPTLDPIGTCVGPNSSRIQSIVGEINGEKIDIIPYEEDLRDFITNALSPARVTEVNLEEDEGVAQVVVPEDQLSLAIGKGGQNARLTAKLTGWSIDIYSEQEFADMRRGAAREMVASIFKEETEEEGPFELTDLEGVGPGLAENLRAAGLETPPVILDAGEEALTEVEGIGASTAASIHDQVSDLVEEKIEEVGEGEDSRLRAETAEEVKRSLFGDEQPVEDAADGETPDDEDDREDEVEEPVTSDSPLA